MAARDGRAGVEPLAPHPCRKRDGREPSSTPPARPAALEPEYPGATAGCQGEGGDPRAPPYPQLFLALSSDNRPPESQMRPLFSWSSCLSLLGAIRRGRFGNVGGCGGFVRLDHHADSGVEFPRHAAQHAQGVALVPGRFQAGDLLLRGLQAFRQLSLGQPGSLPKCRDLQCHIPSLTRPFEPAGERGIL